MLETITVSIWSVTGLLWLYNGWRYRELHTMRKKHEQNVLDMDRDMARFIEARQKIMEPPRDFTSPTRFQ